MDGLSSGGGSQPVRAYRPADICRAVGRRVGPHRAASLQGRGAHTATMPQTKVRHMTRIRTRTPEQKEARRRYEAAHRAEINARKRAYDAAHREHVRAQKRVTQKRYREAHKEELKARHNLYRRGVGRETEYKARQKVRYEPVWREVVAAGRQAMTDYLASQSAKVRFHFAEWFSRNRRILGRTDLKLRGRFGVYEVVYDFGI